MTLIISQWLNLDPRGIGSECPKATEFCFLDAAKSSDENMQEPCQVTPVIVVVVTMRMVLAIMEIKGASP